MTTVKALHSFCGAISMHMGEVRNFDNKNEVANLINDGLVEEVVTVKATKKKTK